jgi:hypothetical protein
MNGGTALRTALALARQQLEPASAFVFEMVLDHTGPIREGWHDGVFHFTLRLDRPFDALVSDADGDGFHGLRPMGFPVEGGNDA